MQREIAPNQYLLVRDTEGGLWSVERVINFHNCAPVAGDILAHVFGSTPLFTRTCQSAMRLANYCHSNGPPAGLRWIKATPNNLPLALETVQQREVEQSLPAPMLN
jgi:hypothetical protein